MIRVQLLTVLTVWSVGIFASNADGSHHRQNSAPVKNSAGFNVKKTSQSYILQKSLDEAFKDENSINSVENYWEDLSRDVKYHIIQNKKTVINNLTNAFVAAMSMKEESLSLDYKKEKLKYQMNKDAAREDCLSCLYPEEDELFATKEFENALLVTIKETIRVKILELTLD